LVKSPIFLSLLPVVAFVNPIDDPVVLVVLPVYAEAHWGSAAGLGLLLGADRGLLTLEQDADWIGVVAEAVLAPFSPASPYSYRSSRERKAPRS
jgi:hypothetical protein